MSGRRRNRRAILLGIDGGTFDILDPWAAEGLLPNFARLLERGTRGDLASTIPPTTPPAWTSCVTGKHPGRHGVYDFREYSPGGDAGALVSSASVRSDRIWDLLGRNGKKCGVMNVPLTWPPEQIRGFMISGMMTPSRDVDFTRPSDLRAELLSRCGDYVIDVETAHYDTGVPGDALRFLRDTRACLEKRREAFLYLLDEKQWDFFMVVFVAADRIQHFFWKYLVPDDCFRRLEHAPILREEIHRCYALLDSLVGDVLARLDGSTDLFVMSDHGFGSTEKWFNVDFWLEDALAGCADLSRVGARFAGVASQGIVISTREDPREKITPREREYEELRTRLREQLTGLRDPATGEEIVERVLFREDLSGGSHTGLAPDLLLIPRDYAVLGRSHPGARNWLESNGKQPGGFHRPNGIFIASGKHIRSGACIEGANIVDIMPTVLHAMGEPVPDDLDGRVLEEIFEPDYRRGNPVGYRPAVTTSVANGSDGYTSADTEAVRKQLAALGYIE